MSKIFKIFDTFDITRAAVGSEATPFISDLATNLESRSGLSMVATTGSNAAILPSVAQFCTGGSNINTVLESDITFTNGEIIVHAAQASGSTSAQGWLFGEGGNSWLNLRTTTAIWVRLNGTVLQFAVANWSTTAMNVVRMVMTNSGTTKVRIWCNDVESSSGEQDAGAIKTLVIHNVGYDTGESEIAYVNVVNNGVDELTLHPQGRGLYEYDESGSNNYCTWTATPTAVYRADASPYLMDSGFTIYERVDEVDEYVPYGADASIITTVVLDNERYNYLVKETIAGSATKHNLAPSLIDFVGATFDRSDTAIWENTARAGFYDAGNTNRWHTTELNQQTFKLWLKSAYQEIVFTKFSDNEIGTGSILEQIFSYSTVKVTTELSKVLAYTNYKFAPASFTASFVVDTILAQLDWVDAYSGTAPYEVWRAYNGGAKELITTTAAGAITYNDTDCKQNVNVKYYVRAKPAGHSAFSVVDLFATPLCMKTDQSVLTDVVFSVFTIVVGKPVTVNWGDGNTDVLTSQYNNDLTHDYGVGNEGQYNIWLTGGVDSIRFLEALNQIRITGDITNWVFPYNVGGFHMYSTGLTGDCTNHIASMDGPNFVVYDAQYLQITGDVSGWRFADKEMYDVHFEGTLVTGDISGWTFPTTVSSSSAKIMLFDTLLTGDLSNWVMSDGNNILLITGSYFVLDITNFYIPDTCAEVTLNNASSYTNNITGDLSGFVIPTNPSAIHNIVVICTDSDLTGDMRTVLIPAGTKEIYLDFARNNVTYMPRGEFRWVSNFNFTANSCGSDEIDALLAYIDAYFTGGVVPLINAVYTLSGTGMGVPSAAGLISKTSIEGKYTTASKTITIAVAS